MLLRILAATLLTSGLTLVAQAEDEEIPGALDTKRIEKELEQSFSSLKMEIHRSFEELSMGVEHNLNNRVEAVEEQFEEVAARLRQRFADALAEFDADYEALMAKVAEATSEQALNEEMADITVQLKALRDQVVSLRKATKGYFEPPANADADKVEEPTMGIPDEPAAPAAETAEEPAEPEKRGLFRR